MVHLPDCHQRFTTTAKFAKLAKIFAQSRRNFAVQTLPTDRTLSSKYVSFERTVYCMYFKAAVGLYQNK